MMIPSPAYVGQSATSSSSRHASPRSSRAGIGECHARHALFNLKLPMKKRYDEVHRREAIIREALQHAHVWYTPRFAHLYHDRKEITDYCARIG
jgi:23S rRNA C2498 (ribose-2'-O)-methylase RlmM